MKTAFLLVGDYNVIIVDWRGGNGLPYTQATANTRLVGAEISLMIEKLETVFGADPRTFHILGHSLGSHAAGYAGERLKRLGRITGMDPAEPYFEKMPKEVRIDPTDADFVDIVHTDGASFFPDVLKGEGLGLYDTVGHVDFYPNGGVKMPGCDVGSRIFKFVTEGLVGGKIVRAMGICHHQRAIDYVIESITNKQCSSLAFECSTHEMFHKGRCSDCGSDGSRCAQMGFWADQWKRFKNNSRTRRMFLDTNADEPFCAYHYLVNVQMSKDSRSSPVTGNFFLTLEGSKGEATVKVNRRTEELYPGAKYTFLVTTPSRVGVIKKASFKYKTDKIFFKSRMFLKHVEILPMNKPTRRTKLSKDSEGPPTMPVKLAANLSTMFKDGSLADRYSTALQMGFKAVECQFPYDTPLEEIRSRKKSSGLEQVLINSYPGDLSKGELGFAAKPGCEGEFLRSLETTLNYAKALNCNKVHVMAGVTGGHCDKSMEETYVKNLRKAADMFEKEDIVGVIEPLCKQVKPGYFLDNYEKGAKYVAEINHKNMRLLLDVFHMQMLSGNLTNTIREIFPLVGHVQVSQAPNRQEPSAPGEINYRYIFELIEELGYRDWIGLEYFPSGSTADSITWIKDYGYVL
ncbi:LOW QUALITY PROTEIN: phospholipase A1 member A [Ixodes scapularis]|uniref:LOW QUALITY PROTEIN: phospholipase A1 member A n=1 Tax=Ixodes scapularis TaxID=6945 RepID=UPI001C383583|nr:LOW QUALITY PROTEIN: phospholipase A1 member A [Ixodes scapularis]